MRGLYKRINVNVNVETKSGFHYNILNSVTKSIALPVTMNLCFNLHLPVCKSKKLNDS